MSQYTTVSFTAGEDETAIITALLMGNGFEGIEEKEDGTVASVPTANFEQAVVTGIFEKFRVAYHVNTIAQQNWNASWEASFEPVVVEDFAVVRASFHQPIPGIMYDIIITPKMSFGTGHHATTFMMLQAMRDLRFAGRTVIDFGTGTAVLAILAEKMGASDILAIDNDEWSINNAQENIGANFCHNITLQMADKMPVENRADIILANINLNVIDTNLTNIKLSCYAHTTVLISGFLVEDEQKMAGILSAQNFRIIKIIYKNNWMAMLIKTL